MQVSNDTLQFPLLSLLCLIFLAIGTTLANPAEELMKELGTHVIRETCHKVWEYVSSGEFLDDAETYAEAAVEFVKDNAADAAQAVFENM